MIQPLLQATTKIWSLVGLGATGNKLLGGSLAATGSRQGALFEVEEKIGLQATHLAVRQCLEAADLIRCGRKSFELALIWGAAGLVDQRHPGQVWLGASAEAQADGREPAASALSRVGIARGQAAPRFRGKIVKNFYCL